MISYGSGLNCSWLMGKIDNAHKLIQDWLNKSNYQVYLSISGGKDSLVAGDLIFSVFPKCPMIWVNQGPLAEWDDCIELLNMLREKYNWNIIELCPARGLLQLYEDLGLSLEGSMNNKLDHQINKRLFYDVLDEYQESNNIKGYAWGLRKESRGRSMYLKKYGKLYRKKDNIWVCSPVGDWATVDIWNYIDTKELPYAAIYDRDKMSIRNGPPIGLTGVNWGRIAELKMNHLELYQKFIQYFPEISNHA